MLIAIEGIDGSGKGTQARQLYDRLIAEGTSAAVLSFPRYSETVFGGLIGDYLNGRFGTLEQVHPLLASLLFSGDRFESLAVLRNACERHEVVILDRYTASNIAHQGSRATAEEQPQLMDLIDRIEHEVFRLPRADLTVLLDIPVEIAVDLIARKTPRDYTERTADLHEANVSYLEDVRKVYQKLAETKPGWHVVSVTEGNTVRPIAEIGNEIASLVEARRGR